MTDDDGYFTNSAFRQSFFLSLLGRVAPTFSFFAPVPVIFRAMRSILVAVALLTFGVIAEAQQARKIPRIGYISGSGSTKNQGPFVAALRQGMRDLGYVDGKNFEIEYRGAEGKLENITTLVQELIQLNVDILVTPLPPALRAAEDAVISRVPIEGTDYCRLRFPAIREDTL